jgi:hypothetical protein
VEVAVAALPFLEGEEVEEVPLLLFQGVEEEEEVHPCQEEGVEVEVLHPFQGVVVEVVALIQGLALTCSPTADVY